MKFLSQSKLLLLSLARTLAVFNTAPYPVEIPQPRRQTFSSGALSATYKCWDAITRKQHKYIQIALLKKIVFYYNMLYKVSIYGTLYLFLDFTWCHGHHVAVPKQWNWRPCWCPNPTLRELKATIMLMSSFVLVEKHGCWSCEWNPRISLYDKSLTWQAQKDEVWWKEE